MSFLIYIYICIYLFFCVFIVCVFVFFCVCVFLVLLFCVFLLLFFAFVLFLFFVCFFSQPGDCCDECSVDEVASNLSPSNGTISIEPSASNKFSGTQFGQAHQQLNLKRQNTNDTQSERRSSRDTVISTAIRKIVEKESFATHIWNFLEDPRGSRASAFYARCMFLFSFVTVWIAPLQTLDPPPLEPDVNYFIETSIDLIFAAEAALRWCTSRSFCGFLRSFWGLLDVSSLIVLMLRIYDFAEQHESNHREWVRTILFCTVPTLRLMKALRTFSNLRLLIHALHISSQALTVPLFMLAVLVLISLFLYFLYYSNALCIPPGRAGRCE